MLICALQHSQPHAGGYQLQRFSHAGGVGGAHQESKEDERLVRHVTGNSTGGSVRFINLW